jgi:hypothetical protein
LNRPPIIAANLTAAITNVKVRLGQAEVDEKELEREDKAQREGP